MAFGSNDADDDLVSLHEAAHAVVAHMLGGHVRLVTIESEEEGHEGHSEIAWPRSTPEELAALSARVALAGPLAELAHRGQDVLEDPDVVASWEQDWREVTRAADLVEATLERREARIQTWMAEVRDLLEDPGIAERIARVADALSAHGTLDDVLFDDCVE
jgi:hypothetical protein